MPRKPLPADERRSEVLQVRLSGQEKTELERGAKRMGISVGSLMRDSALSAVRHNYSFNATAADGSR